MLDDDRRDYISLDLTEAGDPRISVDLGQGSKVAVIAGYGPKFTDGQWHTLEVIKTGSVGVAKDRHCIPIRS